MAERLVSTEILTRGGLHTWSTDTTLQYMPLKRFSGAAEQMHEQRSAGMRELAQNILLPDLMGVGIAKAQGIPRTDARIVDADRRMVDDVAAIIKRSEGEPTGGRIAEYHIRLANYMDGKSGLDPLREFVTQTFQPVFNGKEDFLADLQTYGPGLVIGTHNTHTPEIDVMDWENGKVVHDTGPVVTRIAMDAALAEEGLSVARLTRSPQPSDFYQRVMDDLGNVILSEGGVDEVAEQMKAVISAGAIPTLSPEGGFRVLEKWNTGPVVLAVKAGLPHVHLVAQSPLVSLLDPQMSFDYLGTYKIPEEVVDGVQNGKREPVSAFSDQMRSTIAAGIQDLPYPTAYKNHVAKFAK